MRLQLLTFWRLDTQYCVSDMEMLNFVLRNYVRSRLGADGENYALVVGAVIQSTKHFQ